LRIETTILNTLSFISFLLTSALVQVVHGASFQGLGDLPGGSVFSYAFAVSADGRVVVGNSSSMNGTQA